MQEHSRLEPYTLHVFDIAYFSGKMQAYLAYKGIPHRTHEIGWAELVDRIAPRTGLVEVPVVECADGTVLRDSTAMIEWFEQRYRDAAVLPEDPAAAFYCRLLEDYADVERHYRDELADLEAVFRLRPFLFGDRPSLADFGYFASMFRHFGIDPTPSRIMRNRAPAVYEWVARLWNARCGAYRQAGWAVGEGGQPAGLEPLLARAARRYLPALLANARAVAGRRRHYTATLEGRSYPRLRAVPFQAWRRSVLQRELARLPTAAAGPVRATITRTGCLDWLERDGVLESGYEEGDRLPQCTPRRFGLASRMRRRLFGTPHHLAAPGSRP